jgi:hypothetical protein
MQACDAALSLFVCAILTNIMYEVNQGRQQELEAEEIAMENHTSVMSDSELLHFSDTEARRQSFERKINRSSVKEFIEEMGQDWHLATRLSDQMIKELRQNF